MDTLKEYTYDVNNQLTKLVKKTNNIITLEQNNEYNGSGQRIRKTENGNITNYYYQDGVVLYTTDGSNKKTSFNLYGTSKNVIATIRYSDSGDSSSYLYNKDVHTSITSIINKDNQGVIGYIYDDYGQTEATGEIGFYNEICYTGGIYDKSTGLYYLNARYYNPEDGRFITQDTERGDKKDPTSLVLYQYCASNPINYMDPSGHRSIPLPIPFPVSFPKLKTTSKGDWVGKFLESLKPAKESDVKRGYKRIVTRVAFDIFVPVAYRYLKLYSFIKGAGKTITQAKGHQTAGDIISREKKGAINREFPAEWKDATLNEIDKEAKKGNKSAQKAKKLLKDKRFDKKDNRK